MPMLAMRLTRFPHIVDLNRVDGAARRRAPERHAHDPKPMTRQARRRVRRHRRRPRPPLRRQGAAADRSLPDPQPRHGRGFDRPRRLRLRAARGRARARRRARGRPHRRSPAASRPPTSSRAPGPPRSSPTRSSPRSTSRCGRVAAASWSTRSPAAAVTSRSPVSSCAVELERRRRGARVRRSGSSAWAPRRSARVDAEAALNGTDPERGRPHRDRRVSRSAGLHSDATTCTRRPSTGRSVGAHLVQRALDQALGAARSG